MPPKTGDKSFKLSRDLLDDWQELVEYLSLSFNVDMSFVTRISDDDLKLIVVNEAQQDKFPPGFETKIYGTYCEKTSKSKHKPHNVSDGRKNPEYANKKDFSKGHISYLGFPIRLPTGELFGTLCVENHTMREYTKREIAQMEVCRDLIETHLSITLNSSAEQRKSLKKIDEADSEDNLVTVCAHCRKLKIKDGLWVKLDDFLGNTEKIKFSHGVCPTCMKKIYD